MKTDHFCLDAKEKSQTCIEDFSFFTISDAEYTAKYSF
jgi:hypothetical protein